MASLYVVVAVDYLAAAYLAVVGIVVGLGSPLPGVAVLFLAGIMACTAHGLMGKKTWAWKSHLLLCAFYLGLYSALFPASGFLSGRQNPRILILLAVSATIVCLAWWGLLPGVRRDFGGVTGTPPRISWFATVASVVLGFALGSVFGELLP
jgi:hypothetical protein